MKLKTKNENSLISITLIFLLLGLTSFGGPIAHLSYFRAEFVTKRKWLTEKAFADLIALCQFLPGPASSQVCISLGLLKRGLFGGLCAWAGFTLPSAFALIYFACKLSSDSSYLSTTTVHNLKIITVAIVAHAVWGMSKKLCKDKVTIFIMVFTAISLLLRPRIQTQILAIFFSGLFSSIFIKGQKANYESSNIKLIYNKSNGLLSFMIFISLLIGLPYLCQIFKYETLLIIDSFYRSGSLVFGGGHVVLPLLEKEVVGSNWLGKEIFLVGYGMTQAVPGPLFTFSAFLGSSINIGPEGILGGLLCLFAIYLPSFLLVIGVTPFWEGLRGERRMQSILRGVNASVVGLLLAALYDPIITSTIHNSMDLIWSILAFLALSLLKLQPLLLIALAFSISYLQ